MAIGVLDHRESVSLSASSALRAALRDRHSFVVPVDVIVTILSTVLVHTASQLNERFLAKRLKSRSLSEAIIVESDIAEFKTCGRASNDSGEVDNVEGGCTSNVEEAINVDVDVKSASSHSKVEAEAIVTLMCEVRTN